MDAKSKILNSIFKKPGELKELIKNSTVVEETIKPEEATPKPNLDYDYDAKDEPYVSIGLHGLKAASQKLLAVNRGFEDPDERDSVAFKKYFSTGKIINERIRTDVGGSRKKLLRLAASRKNLNALSPFHFNDYTEKQLVGNPLSAPLDEINPMQLIENARRTTMMGPGGISGDDSVTDSMRNVTASQFGFIDAVSGPESSRIGVDNRIAWKAKLGTDGRIYQIYRNMKTGELEYLNANDLADKIVKLPD